LSSTFIHLPSDYFTAFVEAVGGDAFCSTEFCFFDDYETAIENLEPINIRFGNQHYTIHAKEYLINGSAFGESDKYFVGIVKSLHD